MAEGGGLLNRYTGQPVSGVRIPLSPPVTTNKLLSEMAERQKPRT